MYYVSIAISDLPIGFYRDTGPIVRFKRIFKDIHGRRATLSQQIDISIRNKPVHYDPCAREPE